MLEIGSIVDGKYKILRVVGKGGMSVVYQAVNEKANKIWAIKEVRKDGVQNYEVVKQNLIVETELLKRFNHPNLPSIIDVIDGDGTFLIVMDYIEGNSLSKALEQSGAQSQEDVIEWSKQLCDVLWYLHTRKPPIIYRDMKPSNVMLKPDGNISLIDFGTAREFKSSSVEDTTCLGTQGYAAPEQYGGHGQTDARTDIYCLGATMYHLVTGHNPSTPPYEMYPIRQWNPMLSSGLEEIILKCTQRNPDDRYQSCAELLYALDHYQDLDIENKKVQRFKWNTFIASVIITVVMLFGTIGFSVASSAMTTQTYSSLISAGDNISGSVDLTEDMQREAEEKYLKAITEVEPDNIEAYIHLLDLYMSDMQISSSEFTTIQKYINQYESLLKNNDESKYINDLIVPLADDLFFSFETQNGSSSIGIGYSSKWYKKIADSDSASESNKTKAELLYTIANNYNTKGKMGSNGETDMSITQYWENLQKLIDPNLIGKSNLLITLRVYRFVAAEMIANVENWKMYNISEKNYLDAFRNIKEYTDSITQSDVYALNRENLEMYVKDIYSFVDRANTERYGNTNTGAAEGAGN